MEQQTSSTETLVRREVARLLETSPAYRALPPGERQKLAADMVRIGLYLAEPEGIRATREIVGFSARENNRGRVSDVRVALGLPDEPRSVECEGTPEWAGWAAPAGVRTRDVVQNQRSGGGK